MLWVQVTVFRKVLSKEKRLRCGKAQLGFAGKTNCLCKYMGLAFVQE